MNPLHIDESIDSTFDPTKPVVVNRRPQKPENIGVKRTQELVHIDLDRLVPDPEQPRKERDPEKHAQMVSSLKRQGQLQPAYVLWDEKIERFMILNGERRWRAASEAGMPSLRCVICPERLTSEQIRVIQIVENTVREDLTPSDQAKAFKSLIDQQAWSVEQLAEHICMSRPLIVQRLSLLKLPEPVIEQMDQGNISAHAAYIISQVAAPEDQKRIAQEAVDRKYTTKDIAKACETVPKNGRTLKFHPAAQGDDKPQPKKRIRNPTKNKWASKEHNIREDGVQVFIKSRGAIELWQAKPAVLKTLAAIEKDYERHLAEKAGKATSDTAEAEADSPADSDATVQADSRQSPSAA